MSAVFPTQGTSYVNTLALTVAFVCFGFLDITRDLVSN